MGRQNAKTTALLPSQLYTLFLADMTTAIAHYVIELHSFVLKYLILIF